jgi:hypothetical protein
VTVHCGDEGKSFVVSAIRKERRKEAAMGWNE